MASEPFQNIDKLLTDDLLRRISASTECSVCSEVMIVPVLLACGHSFCYDCCNSWFDTKVTCPTCRHELEHPPILNVQLKEIANYLIDMTITHEGDAEEAERLQQRRDEANKSYNYDLNHNKLYGETFKSVMTLVDNSDGVPRCGNCHWEAHGEECLHCGARFRIARDDDYYDSAEAYDEDDEEIQLYGRDEGDRYDSEDSFVDGRDYDEINQDLQSDTSHLDDASIALMGEIQVADNDDWTGFDDNNSESDSDYNEDDLHTAIHEFNQQPISIGDEDEDDSPASRGSRRNIIPISDDED